MNYCPLHVRDSPYQYTVNGVQRVYPQTAGKQINKLPSDYINANSINVKNIVHKNSESDFVNVFVVKK